MRIAERFLNNPAMLKVGRVGGAASSVTQKIVYVDGREKTNTCIELLKAVPGKTIVFVNTKRAADTLEMDLSDLGCPAASVHGDQGLATTMINERDGGLARDLHDMLVKSNQEAPDWLMSMRGGGGSSNKRGKGGGGYGYGS